MTDYLPPSQEALPCNNNFFDAKLTGGGGGGGGGGVVVCGLWGWGVDGWYFCFIGLDVKT